MKKRKEEILRDKEQSSVQHKEPEQSSSIQSTVQSNYVYGVGMLAVLAIGVCVFFAYNTLQPKKLLN